MTTCTTARSISLTGKGPSQTTCYFELYLQAPMELWDKRRQKWNFMMSTLENTRFQRVSKHKSQQYLNNKKKVTDFRKISYHLRSDNDVHPRQQGGGGLIQGYGLIPVGHWGMFGIIREL